VTALAGVVFVSSYAMLMLSPILTLKVWLGSVHVCLFASVVSEQLIAVGDAL
jgi:hypothetical protein